MGTMPSEQPREEKILCELLEREDIWGYLQTRPTTRHEAWLLVSALANICLMRELRAFRETLEDGHGGNGKGERKKLSL